MGYFEIGYCVATLFYIWILLIPLVGVFRRRVLKSTFFINDTAMYRFLKKVEKGDLNKSSVAEISFEYTILYFFGGAIISFFSIIFYPLVLVYLLVSIIFKNKLNKK